MNYKEATGEIPINDHIKQAQAYGYLEADAQWRERVKPLVEALERIKSICDSYGMNPPSNADEVCFQAAKKALSDFRAGEGK